MTHEVIVERKKVRLVIYGDNHNLWVAELGEGWAAQPNQITAELLAAQIAEHNGPVLPPEQVRQIRASIASGTFNLSPARYEGGWDIGAPEGDKEVKVVRDTETGEFTTKEEAKKDPKGTVTETVKRKRYEGDWDITQTPDQKKELARKRAPAKKK